MRSVQVKFAAWTGPKFVAFVLAVGALNGAAVQVSPSSFDIFSENPGLYERTIDLVNPSADPVTLELHVNFTKVPAQARRRLDDTGLAHPTPQTSFVAPLSGRRRARMTPSQHVGRQLGLDKSAHSRCVDRSRLLLRFRPDSATSGSASEEHGAKLRRLQQDPDLAISGWHHLAHVNIDVADLDCSAGLTPEEIMNRFQTRYGSQLELVEIDQWVWPTQAPSDPSWSQLWGMTRTKVEAAWARLASLNIDAQTQPEVIVAVIDTGVKLDHPDLVDMLWTNPGEVPGNGIDDDGNGYVDDVHGYDFHLNEPNGNDVQGHGTHCAGVIGAEADNGIGVAGVASKHARVRIMALGFLGTDGGVISNALRALEYAVAMGAPISSNSWGGGGASQAFQAALRAAPNHLFIAAAGNEGNDNDASPMYPCSYPEANVICVAATTSSDTLASYSNYGATKVHIAAPGSSIYSTYTSADQYTYLSGTSMATPYVAGAAALVASAFPHLGTQDIKQLMLASSEVVPWLSGRVQTGLLDVLSFVSLAEASSWLWLLPNGAAQKVMSTSLTVGGGSSIGIGLHIGLPLITAGFYYAAVEVSWPNGRIQVPVSYIVQGSPDLQLTSTSSLLDWQVVSVGASVEKLIGFFNNGNGTARIQVDALSQPFGSSGEVLEVLPSESAWVKFTCAPSVTGNWSALATIRTNSGLDAWEATLPGNINQGTQYVVSLECESRGAPYLSLDRHSGASLVPTSGHPQHFEPSVPAEWEAALPEGDNSIAATLVIADAGNPEGCNAHTASAVQGGIVLVSRGSCYFQVKAQHAQDAGAVGVIIYDNLDVTTLVMMAMPDNVANPSIPGYLIPKALGLSLKSRVEATEPLRVAMNWKPVHLWTNHPLANGGPASAAIVMSNVGHMPLSWSVRVKLGFNKDQNQFYDTSYTGMSSGTPPSFKWATLDATSELTYFSGKNLDDDALAFSIPFRFPFFGELFDSVWISSNGVLIFDATFVPGTDHAAYLPSRSAPNGLVAGFWRDLVCGSAAKISAKHLTDTIGDFLVVQFEDLSYFDVYASGHAGSDLVSFEIRLYNSGQIIYNFKEFPTSSTLLSGVIVGLETIDGAHGVDMKNLLPFSAGQPFAASFIPWLAPVGNPSSSVPPGESLSYNFAVQGLSDQKGFITVVASDSTGSWKTERRVRLMQQAFVLSWHAESWAPCVRNTCGVAGPSTKTRAILCHGSDGAAYDISHCSNAPQCNDVPNWVDTQGHGCAKHVMYGWCTSTGGLGPNWLGSWGSFVDFAAGGHTAATACCGCGGGVVSVMPVSNESCSDGIDLDTDVDGLPDCLDGTASDTAKFTTTNTTTTTSTTTTNTTTITTTTSTINTDTTTTNTSATTSITTTNRTTSSTETNAMAITTTTLVTSTTNKTNTTTTTITTITTTTTTTTDTTTTTTVQASIDTTTTTHTSSTTTVAQATTTTTLVTTTTNTTNATTTRMTAATSAVIATTFATVAQATTLATSTVPTTTILAFVPASLATTLTTSAAVVAMAPAASTTAAISNFVKTTTTVRSSMVLLGVEWTTGIEVTIIAALAGALGVDRSQIKLLNSEQFSGEGVRRLAVGLTVDFEVVFETVDESPQHATEDAVSSPGGHTASSSGSASSANSSGSVAGASSPAPSAAGTSADITNCLNSLKQMSEDPQIFVTHLTAAFEEQGSTAPVTLQVQLRQPTMQRVLVQRISGPWSACQDENGQYPLSDPCSDRPGQQASNISCINASDPSDGQPEALCQGLPALPNERQCIIAGQTVGECMNEREVLEGDPQKAVPQGEDAAEGSMGSEFLRTPVLLLWTSSLGLFTLLAIVCVWRKYRRRSCNLDMYVQPSLDSLPEELANPSIEGPMHNVPQPEAIAENSIGIPEFNTGCEGNGPDMLSHLPAPDPELEPECLHNAVETFFNQDGGFHDGQDVGRPEMNLGDFMIEPCNQETRSQSSSKRLVNLDTGKTPDTSPREAAVISDYFAANSPRPADEAAGNCFIVEPDKDDRGAALVGPSLSNGSRGASARGHTRQLPPLRGRGAVVAQVPHEASSASTPLSDSHEDQPPTFWGNSYGEAHVGVSLRGACFEECAAPLDHKSSFDSPEASPQKQSRARPPEPPHTSEGSDRRQVLI